MNLAREHRGRRLALLAAAGAAAAGVVPALAAASRHSHQDSSKSHHRAIPRAGEAGQASNRLSNIKHIVVIYQENHSFDNLYGGWEGTNGRPQADAAHTLQSKQTGGRFACLLQNDKNLASPPQPSTCTDTTGTATGSSTFSSAFPNAPFQIDAPGRIPASATTCPNGAPNGTGQPGGCTEDIVHRFYQEQYQLDQGAQDRYAAGSDAAGLTMGYYDTRSLPIYSYLHSDGHPHYAVADNFFQAAFGGSFLNHQWLIAAQTPSYPGAPASVRSVLDDHGMPVNGYPLYKTSATVKDSRVTASCPAGSSGSIALPADGGRQVACGDYAINTIQPTYAPHAPGAQLPPLTQNNIGDELSDAGVSWAWYAGGWANADGEQGSPYFTAGNGPMCPSGTVASPTYPNCADPLFQYHHQPFNYYAKYAPGTAARTNHLRDEQEFIDAANASGSSCNLREVSFVKPVGSENEHPGYTSETAGSNHLVALLKAIEGGACARDTMVVVTYDEFGGQWDHVPPPGQGNSSGPHDLWGPGTRIPALVLAPRLPGQEVIDSTEHDTTSILATIEHRYGLAPLSSRDQGVADLSSVYGAHEYAPGQAQDERSSSDRTAAQAESARRRQRASHDRS